MSRAKKLIYLSGAMDAAPDHGAGWRRAMSTSLAEMGGKCFNPCDVEETIAGVSGQELMALREGNKAVFIEKTRKLIQHDLEVIRSKTGCLIAYLDEHPRAGTYGEVVFAYSQRVPVYAICAVPEERIPGWVLACSSEVFSSLEECIVFFRNNVLVESTLAP
jgi:hypothetical protein